MTCPIADRISRLVQSGTQGVTLKITLDCVSEHLPYCVINRVPRREDSQHGEGRGQDAFCEALRDLEASMNLLPPAECLGCAAHAATE